LEGLAIKDAATFHGHLVFGIVCGPFGIFHEYLVYFSRFGMFYQEISGNPALPPELNCQESDF
jgi:hypothetical protein